MSTTNEVHVCTFDCEPVLPGGTGEGATLDRAVPGISNHAPIARLDTHAGSCVSGGGAGGTVEGGGGGVPATVTVVDLLTLPPAPVQVRVKLPLAVSAPVDWLPDVALVPDQPFEAVQVVALVEDQVRVEDAPLATEVGFAASYRVGAGNGEGEGEGEGDDAVGELFTVDSSPPPPQAQRRSANSDASERFLICC